MLAVVAPIAEVVGGVLAAIAEGVAAIVGGVSVGWIVAIGAAIVGLVVGAVQLVKHWGWVKRTFADAAHWLGDAASGMASAGASMVSGLVRGISSMGGAVKHAIESLAGSTVDWFKGKLGIHSPSRVFAVLGGYTMDGLALGLARGRDGPLRELALLTAAMSAVAAPLPAAALSPRAVEGPSASATRGATPAGRPLQVTNHSTSTAASMTRARWRGSFTTCRGQLSDARSMTAGWNDCGPCYAGLGSEHTALSRGSPREELTALRSRLRP